MRSTSEAKVEDDGTSAKLPPTSKETVARLDHVDPSEAANAKPSLPTKPGSGWTVAVFPLSATVPLPG